MIAPYIYGVLKEPFKLSQTVKKKILIIKESGETAEFSDTKLRASLMRAGASNQQIDSIIEQIESKLHPGISTRSIYKQAFSLLKESSRHLAARYHLKRAIMELGPSGYPFEKYIGEILRIQGYEIKIGEIVQGKCVQHEVDVLASKDQHQLMVECKYHNQPGHICDIKVPLYIHSRFTDIVAQWNKTNNDPNIHYEGWVATNTQFSQDAIQYSTCIGLKLLGWNYPAKGSLKSLIDSLGLYPITCLTSLTAHEKQELLDKKIVLCREIQDNQKLLDGLHIKSGRQSIILQETHLLCGHLRTNEVDN